MSGYFSRIIRQSGARVGSAELRPRHSADVIAPIDREETLIVSPQEPASPGVTRRDTANVEPARRTPKLPTSESVPESIKAGSPLLPSSVPREPEIKRAAPETREQAEDTEVVVRHETPRRSDDDAADRPLSDTSSKSVDTHPTTTDAITIQPS